MSAKTQSNPGTTAEQSAPAQAETRNWIAVVSRDHALESVESGFSMLDHGKLGPLLRLTPGDWLIYYSPRTMPTGGEVLKAFTAIGTVKDAEPYQIKMHGGAMGFRRDIDWLDATEAQLAELTQTLDFTRGSWGMLARRGLFEITDADRHVIRAAMTGK
ncbi:EVE domain-containing protein [Paracoccus saliphilus]|uniref:UPF0310 protein JHX88_13585 n=1 Tax=Paracoccus saliphilus TaxID=405559 RepID=A0AA45W2C5_9RHOB|nr:EVE domain-containing protein [Paracoccus saliphilus]WCR01942.1 EVE domain-containing protein [Paracoccus saliphilus]SIS65505.1 EVE domain-containing protein [Paracoccus saliphilus]